MIQESIMNNQEIRIPITMIELEIKIGVFFSSMHHHN